MRASIREVPVNSVFHFSVHALRFVALDGNKPYIVSGCGPCRQVFNKCFYGQWSGPAVGLARGCSPGSIPGAVLDGVWVLPSVIVCISELVLVDAFSALHMVPYMRPYFWIYRG